MSVQSLRRLADRCRAIPARSAFGLREHTVSIIRNYWTGNRPGDGDEVTQEIPITVGDNAPPKVRFPSQREIAEGLMSLGSLVIGPFTPSYGTGGLDRVFLDGLWLNEGDGLFIRVIGPQHPEPVLYRLKNVNVDRALRVTIVCVPVTPR